MDAGQSFSRAAGAPAFQERHLSRGVAGVDGGAVPVGSVDIDPVWELSSGCRPDRLTIHSNAHESVFYVYVAVVMGVAALVAVRLRNTNRLSLILED